MSAAEELFGTYAVDEARWLERWRRLSLVLLPAIFPWFLFFAAIWRRRHGLRAW